MEIRITKLIGKKYMDKAASFTVDKDVEVSKLKMYKAEHSPMRTQVFWIEMFDIPTFVSVHLVRHEIGVEHFVKSNRDDRKSHTGDQGRMQPVNHAMIINAQALINIARKRLCNKTHELTRKVMRAIRVELLDHDKELVECMIPECDYRGGVCHEFVSCGRY